jgi:hypothetical protein
MAKFAKPIDDDTPTPAATVVVETIAPLPRSQSSESVNFTQNSIDSTIYNHQLNKEDEHWVKAYWRPAMGWLYMAINLMDFIVFPIISIILPVIYKGFGLQIGYTAWQSLSLSNGGMIHIAFGAILGIAAYTRGQEKIAKIGS